MGCGPHSCLATFLGPPNLIVEPPVRTRTNSLPSSWGLKTQHETNKKVIAVSGRERIDNQSVMLVIQSCDSLQPHGLQPARLLCHGILQARKYWSGLSCPPPGGSFWSNCTPKTKFVRVTIQRTNSFFGGGCWILVEEHRIFSCGMRALVALLGIKPESPVLQRGVSTTGQPGKSQRTP